MNTGDCNVQNSTFGGAFGPAWMHQRQSDAQALSRGSVNIGSSGMIIAKTLGDKSGKIVIISSIASFWPIAFHAGYSASKAAVRMIADSWRMALKKYHIQLTSICPGFIVSEMTDANKFPMPFLLQTDDSFSQTRRFIFVVLLVFLLFLRPSTN